MRKFLMASAATLGAVGMVGAASAQPAPAPAPNYLEGQVISTPNPTPPAFANTNNSYQAAALPGAVAVPTPGTFVVKLNAAVVVEAAVSGSTFNAYTQAAAATTSVTSGAGAGAVAFGPTAGTYKQNPQTFYSYVRIYPGVDAMATNGLRYGAQVELRENWASTTITGSTINSSSASAESSTQTMFVRRAFVYAASDKVGIIRFGQADSVMGIFDNGVTTFQSVSPSGGMNGSDVQTPLPQNTVMPFPFYAQNGIDYSNQKIVYLSPQFAGFDIGLEYAPSNSNAEQMGGICTNGVTANPSALGVSGVNATNCTSLSSSPTTSDAIRYTNQYQVGLRYQGTFGPVAVLAHGAYMGSGIVDYTGSQAAGTVGAKGGSLWNGKYQGLSIGQGGVALTVAGLTFGGIVNGGKMNNNGQGTPDPVGGANQIAYLLGFQYNFGPYAVGFGYEHVDSQGSAALVGVTQRHEWGLNPGFDWLVAPGLKVFAEYWYGERAQSDFNFATGSAGGGSAYNQVKSQSFMLGTRVYW
jgi:hypothetical protein